jgi:hypothetical protein
MPSASKGSRPFVSLCVTFILAGSLWAQDATFAQKLYGKWHTYPVGNPTTDPVKHEFRHNSATGADELLVTRTCIAGTHTVVAKAASPIEVTEDSIQVLKNAADSEALQGTAVCQVTITACIMSYSFSEDGEHLLLTNPGGNPDFVDLEPDTNTKDDPISKRLYGTWLLPAVNGKEMRVQTRWVFYATAERTDKIRQIAVCTKGNDSLVSHVDSDVAFTKDQIKVLQAASHEQVAGDFLCKASLAVGTWNYTLAPSGLTLTLHAEGAKPVTLTRENEAGLN